MQQSLRSQQLSQYLNPQQPIHNHPYKNSLSLQLQLQQHKTTNNQSNQPTNQLPSINKFQFDKYKLKQNYFSKNDLIEQDNYQEVLHQDEKYFGGIKHGLKHGMGVMVTKNTIYQGWFSLDHKNGKGFIFYPNQSKYFGDFSNDKPHGHGLLQYGNQYFIGDFQNGSMHGDGLWKNQKGQKYVGKWKTNKAHGYGIYVTKDSHYQGYFSNFQKHGLGLETFANGDIYHGSYSHGKPCGHGQYTWKSTMSYEGNFLSGLRSGSGTWKNQIGDVYVGQFQSDQKNGYGQYTWANGNIYKGNFINDMRQGKGEMTWNDGSVYQGEWKRGLPNGKGVFRVKGERSKYGFFQDNVLVEETKPPTDRFKSIKETKNDVYGMDKPKLYLNIIPEYPKQGRTMQSKSQPRKGNHHKGTSSTMASFKINSVKNPSVWRHK